MQLLHVEFRSLAHSAPQDRPSILMNFHHVAFGFLARESEYTLENHRYISHQVYWIVVHYNQPGKIEIFLGARFGFNGGPFNGCRTGLLV